jgi:type III pantothenate kinase
MLLAIDVGNTHTVLGVFDGEELLVEWRVTTDPEATGDELWVTLKGLLVEGGTDPGDLEALVVASVVPLLSDALQTLCRRYLRLEPLIVSGDMDIGIGVAVEPPRAAGADRLANAVAAGELYGRPAVVVDLGTATTFDVIDADGTYLGGIITPGVFTAAEDLYRRAARLSEVEIEPPADVIGHTTEEGLRSGLYLGTLAMIDGLLARLAERLGARPAVVFTGGLSHPFEEAFQERGAVDPWLTLHGLRLIHRNVTG